jgi:hypothetical protein
MPLERLAQNPLGRSQIAPLAEPELDRVAIAVDRPVEIPPRPADLDVSFVDVPFASDGSLACIETLQQFGRVPDNSPVDSRMVNGDAALGHHLLQVPQA